MVPFLRIAGPRQNVINFENNESEEKNFIRKHSVLDDAFMKNILLFQKNSNQQNWGDHNTRKGSLFIFLYKFIAVTGNMEKSSKLIFVGNAGMLEQSMGVCL